MKHGKIKWKKFNYVCNIEEHLMIRFSITFSLHSPFTFAILFLLFFLLYITHLSFDNVLCFMPFFSFFLHLKTHLTMKRKIFSFVKIIRSKLWGRLLMMFYMVGLFHFVTEKILNIMMDII